MAVNVQALRNLLGGITVSGGEPERLDVLFEGKSGAIVPQTVEMSLLGYSPEERSNIERIMAEDKKKDLMKKRMSRG